MRGHGLLPAFDAVQYVPGGGGEAATAACMSLRECKCVSVNAMASAGCCVCDSLPGCAQFGPETRTGHGSPLDFLSLLHRWD